MRRHRPQAGCLRGYLAKFSAADLSHWIDQASSAERAALAALLMGDFAEQITVDRVVGSESDQQAEADRRRVAFVRAFPMTEPRPRTGMQRLDAALAQLRQSCPQAASVMDAVGGAPCAQGAAVMTTQISTATFHGDQSNEQ